MTAPLRELPPAAPPPEAEVKLTFLEHLRDLRTRLGRAILGVVVGMALVGVFVEKVFHALMSPVLASLPEGQRQLAFLNPIEPLMVYLKLALYGGVFVAAPWVLWQLWLFVAPGLYRKEKRYVVPFLFFGTLLFYTGAAFCYFLVMPPAFPAMLAVAGDASLRANLTMSEMLSLVLAMLLGFGVVFELPVVIAFLSMIGLVRWQTLAKYRRHAIVVNTIIAAIITPTGDPFNLALMAVPMILFYEVGIVLARFLGKKPADAGAPAAG